MESSPGSFDSGQEPMDEFSVPVVVELILERVTNIPMGTDIDNINEFGQAVDLPAMGEDESKQAA